MKRNISLKSIIFSLLLVTGSVSYSATPEFKAGTGTDSIIAGITNKAEGLRSSAFGSINKVDGKWSSVFGNQYEVTGERSGAFGTGQFNGQYQYKNEGNNSYMIHI